MKIRKNIFVILSLIFAPYLLGSVCADEKTVHTAENTLSSSSIINNFSFKLLRAITEDSTKQANIVVSPLSAAFTLGILNNGADGKTKAEIDSVLGCDNACFDSLAHKMLIGFDHVVTSYPRFTSMKDFELDLLPKLKLHETAESSHKTPHKSEKTDTLAQVMMTNGVFVNDKYPLKESYIDKTSKAYSTIIKNMDFTLPETTEYINDLYSERTSRMVSQIIDKISPSACLYALNSTCFKGIWDKTFSKENTKYDDFKKSNGTKNRIKIMSYWDDCLYNKNKIYASINMEIGDGKYSMIVLLPNKGKKIDDILKTIDEDKWHKNLMEMKRRSIIVKIPKFTTINADLQLIKPLSNLGLTSIFDTERIRLRDMSEDSLSISFINQKVRIELNEYKATEEEALLQNIICGDGKIRFTKFYATHPFVYAIVENSTNTILFIGKYEGEEE
jgi:serpin B